MCKVSFIHSTLMYLHHIKHNSNNSKDILFFFHKFNESEFFVFCFFQLIDLRVNLINLGKPLQKKFMSSSIYMGWLNLHFICLPFFLNKLQYFLGSFSSNIKYSHSPFFHFPLFFHIISLSNTLITFIIW